MAPSIEQAIQDHESRLRVVEKTLGLTETVKDHESRIRKLETSSNKMAAYVSMAAFVASGLGQFLIGLLLK